MHFLDEVTLQNNYVKIVPMSEEHVKGLSEIVDHEMWQYMMAAFPDGEVGMRHYVVEAIDENGFFPFTVLDVNSGKVLGSTGFYDYSPSQGRIDLGSTFYARDSWGTKTNASCKYMMLKYAFEDLDLYRVGFRADSRNERSISALKKLGAKYEGTMIGHRVSAGVGRGDSSYFAILQDDWPQVSKNLLNRIDS